MMKTILITNDPVLAAEAEAAGVTRIMIDLETLGKKERQASRQTFISTHTKDDIAPVRAVLKKSQLLVRINPWHEQSRAEIKDAIKGGADIIMLPMITKMSQLDAFLAALNGRAMPLPLIETVYSMEHIEEIAANPQIPELYIGLNDLHLSLGMDFLFEPLARGHLDHMAEIIKAHSKPFGFGGIAAMGSGELPAERILGEHVRLSSTCVILSSRFGKDIHIEDPNGRAHRLQQALLALQQEHGRLLRRNEFQKQEDARQTFALIQKLAAGRKQ